MDELRLDLRIEADGAQYVVSPSVPGKKLLIMRRTNSSFVLDWRRTAAEFCKKYGGVVSPHERVATD